MRRRREDKVRRVFSPSWFSCDNNFALYGLACARDRQSSFCSVRCDEQSSMGKKWKLKCFFFSLVSPSTSSAWWCALSDACIRVVVSRVCCCIVGMLLLAANIFPTAKRREKTVNYGDNLNVFYYDHEWTDLYIKVSGLAKKNNTDYKDEARRANNMERRRAKTFSAAAVIVVTSDTLRFMDDALHWSRSSGGDDIILSEWKELFFRFVT